MRRIGWLVVSLIGIGWLASKAPLSKPQAAATPQGDLWRRTQTGWERAEWLTARSRTRADVLHPGVVGLLQLFGSVYALAAFSPRVAPIPPTGVTRRVNPPQGRGTIRGKPPAVGGHQIGRTWLFLG